MDCEDGVGTDVQRAVSDRLHGVTRVPTRVVLARSRQGFVLSQAAIVRLRDLGHPAALDMVGAQQGMDVPVRRDDPLLVQVVAELGESACPPGAKLAVVIVPARSGWRLEFDGRSEQLVRFKPPKAKAKKKVAPAVVPALVPAAV